MKKTGVFMFVFFGILSMIGGASLAAHGASYHQITTLMVFIFATAIGAALAI